MDKYNIDKIFREGLANSPTGLYNEQHWEELEKRLNKSKKPNRLFLISTLSSVAAAAVLLFFLFKNNTDIIKPINNRIVHSSNKVADSSIHELHNISKHDQRVVIVASNKHHILKYVEPIKLRDKESFQDTFVTVNLDNLIHIDTADHGGMLIVTNIAEREDYVNKLDSTSNLDAHAIANSIDEKQKPFKERRKGNFSVLAALDLTEVRGAAQQKLSEHIGLLYTQPIVKNISVSTGILYSRKNYESPYSFYAPEHPYTGSHMPSDVNAVCDVLSVPILINYHIPSGKKYNITLSSGLSSYFMMKEKYAFYYNSKDYKPYTSTYTIKGENQHYFGVADFSITFDRKINDKFNIGIRPFLQVPLTGIGYGRTNLQSKGVAISFGINP